MANENEKITAQQPDPAANPDPAASTNDDEKKSAKKTKADLEEENAKLLAELEALKAAAAKLEAEGAAAEAAAEREEIFVPKGYANDEPFLIVSVNGVNYQLPKGKSSTVPKFVADEFRRAQRAQTVLDDRIEKMTNASN